MPSARRGRSIWPTRPRAAPPAGLRRSSSWPWSISPFACSQVKHARTQKKGDGGMAAGTYSQRSRLDRSRIPCARRGIGGDMGEWLARLHHEYCPHPCSRRSRDVCVAEKIGKGEAHHLVEAASKKAGRRKERLARGAARRSQG